ncbi:MAG: hypothetical protein J5634_00820 [Bacilli bacterium]|nr:hypothetical protein [Bacilli bacterium]
MENVINYLYSLDIENIYKNNNSYIIKSKNSYYCLNKIDFINDKMKNFINQINSVNYNNSFCYKFQKNIYNEYISRIEDDSYILLNIDQNYNKEIDFFDMLDFYNKSKMLINNQSFNINWDILWENKIDYLLNHLEHSKIYNKKIIPYFYYYIGLSENALLYIKKLKTNILIDKKLNPCFVHRRIDEKNFKISFLNPLNFLIDIKERDVASYIKTLFYKNDDYLNDLDYYLKTNNLSAYEASLLYARIVYPSHFLDYYENHEQTELNVFSFNPESYENFIKKTYELINSYVSIDKIVWL